MDALKSVNQSTDWLGISHWTIRAYIRQGLLRPVRIGRRVLLEPKELQRFVESAKRSQRHSVKSPDL